MKQKNILDKIWVVLAILWAISSLNRLYTLLRTFEFGSGVDSLLNLLIIILLLKKSFPGIILITCLVIINLAVWIVGKDVFVIGPLLILFLVLPLWAERLKKKRDK